jgi:hypothetical protein
MALSTQKETDITKQYDPIRARLQRQEGANLQGQKDTLARNAARLGGAPSGAFIKQEQIAGDESAKRLQEANEGVDVQQMAALNQAREVQEQRDWQTGERIGSQKFMTGERIGTQKFGRSERESSQKFMAGQSALDRKLAEAGLTGSYNGQDTLAMKSFKSAEGQQDFENENNLKTNFLTAFTSLKNSGVPPDQVKAIFSELGLDGLGIDINALFPKQDPSPKAAPPARSNSGAPSGGYTYYSPSAGRNVTVPG